MSPYFNILRSAAIAALLAGAGTACAGTLSTLPSTGNIGSFGNVSSGSTPTYGETFVATAALGLYLHDFTFYYQNGAAGALSYQSQVYNWNGTAITGPALFTTNATIAPTVAAYLGVTTLANDIALQDGSSYIALFTTVNTAGSVGGLRALTSSDSAYADGTFAYNNSATAAGLASSWSQHNFGDLAFTMNFDTRAASAVPEPGSLALIGIALLGAFGARRRKS